MQGYIIRHILTMMACGLVQSLRYDKYECLGITTLHQMAEHGLVPTYRQIQSSGAVVTRVLILNR